MPTIENSDLEPTEVEPEDLENSSMGWRIGALTERVSRRTVRRFYRAFAEQYPSVRSPFTPARRVAAAVGGTAAVIGLLAMGVGVSQELSEGAPDMVGQLIGMGVFVALLLIGAVILVWFYVRVTARRGTPTRHYRLTRFAAENGMTYRPGPASGAHITPWLERGRLVLTRIVRPVSRRPVVYANYELKTGTTGNQNTQFGGLCAIRLSTHLPHILLQARTGRALTAAMVPARAQRLSLEGEFDEHFTLYCPAEYERDALYIFTPDVMARLIDRVNGFDVEIIDDWLFFVTSRDLVTLDPTVWDGLLSATMAVGDKIERWERWRDGRLAAAPSEAAAPRAVPSTDVPSANAPSTDAPSTNALPRTTPSPDEPAPRPAPAARPNRRVAPRGRRLRMSLGTGTILALLGAAVLLAAVLVSNLI
jgi:hypothetical protein